MKPPFKGFNLEMYPKGTCTQVFGVNSDLYKPFGMKGHNGLDHVAEFNTPLCAVEDGVIADAKVSPDGYGRNVRLMGKEKNGVINIWTYGHLEQIHVTIGQKVKAGDVIGTMGNSGFVVSEKRASEFWGYVMQKHPGTHLHIGLRKAKSDPKGWAYPGSTKKIQILNYDNGYKGAIDPTKELGGSAPPNPNEEKQLAIIKILTKVVELYKELNKKK